MCFVFKLKIYPESSMDAVFKHVSVEIMPTEIGGNGKSHYEYSGNSRNNLIFILTRFVKYLS